MKQKESHWKLLPRPWEFDILILITIVAFIWYAARLEREHAPPPPPPAPKVAVLTITEPIDPVEEETAEVVEEEAAKADEPEFDAQGRKIFRAKPFVEEKSSGTLPDREAKKETVEEEPAYLRLQ